MAISLGLVHTWVVGVDVDLPAFHVHLEDIVVGVIGDQHKALAVEADTVANAALGQFYKDTAFTLGCDFADGVLAGIIDRVEITRLIAGWAFNAGSEAFRFSENAGLEERYAGHGGLSL
jgi:hypothetical protein